MTDKRDISTPTSISICLSGKFILIKDLAGKSHIFSIEDKEGIGSKVLELANDDNLPFIEVGSATVTDNDIPESSFDNIDLENLDPENIKKVIIQQGLGWLRGVATYPRGKSVPRKKK